MAMGTIGVLVLCLASGLAPTADSTRTPLHSGLAGHEQSSHHVRYLREQQPGTSTSANLLHAELARPGGTDDEGGDAHGKRSRRPRLYQVVQNAVHEAVHSEDFVRRVVDVVRSNVAGAQALRTTLPPLQNRGEIARVLQSLGLRVGVELGVQRGGFAAETLSVWDACERYYLVDIWRQQENYVDLANVPANQQEQFFKDTMKAVEPWKRKIVVLRNYTTEAISLIKEPLDYVYVDARHDYCGAKQDIELYWSKIRPGGIMAGHDYLAAGDPALGSQDWSICQDGTKHMGAVKGAVDEFAGRLGLQVLVTYRDQPWNSWVIQKPV